MKKLFLMLLIAFMLFPSCQENKMYNAFLDKKGKKVVQLVEKDDTDKIAYLAMFQYSNKDSILKMSKDIAQYYNIEGYDMFIGDSLFYFISEEMKERRIGRQKLRLVIHFIINQIFILILHQKAMFYNLICRNAAVFFFRHTRIFAQINVTANVPQRHHNVFQLHAMRIDSQFPMDISDQDQATGQTER